MEYDSLLREIVSRENNSNCYDVKIDGIPIYRLVRLFVRFTVEKNAGLCIMNPKHRPKYVSLLFSNIKSFWQLLCILIFHKKYSNIIISFPRIEKVGGVYVDKFTDPVIDLCNIKDYIILDHGVAGRHPKPRVHEKSLVYIDFLHTLSAVYVKCRYKHFCRKKSADLAQLKHAIDEIVGGPWDEHQIMHLAMEAFYYCKFFSFLFKRVSAKRVAGPGRGQLVPILIAARNLGMKTYEFQHGITYSESEGLSGIEVPEVEPDVFFAFGDNKPADVYGVRQERMVNIGWAFQDYLNTHLDVKQYGENDILVISDPEVTERMIKVVCFLAESCPHFSFFFRPHPHEVLSPEQEKALKCYDNIHIQDKKINIMEVLFGFNIVIGESSTVLYEALSLGKKVGKVFMMGLNPLYLQPEDKDCFWEIHSLGDFKMFIEGDLTGKKVKSIYSKFDKELFISYFK